MKKYFIVLFLLFVFCGDNSEETPQPEAISTDTTEVIVVTEEESTTTTTEIVQLDSFEGKVYEILKDKSKVGYLAPKQFLNSGLETVEGVTSEIIGEFTLELSECDQSDSCLYITNLLIRVDISTLKSNNSIRDSAIKSQWLESKLFPEAVFKIDELVIPNKNFDSKVEDTVVGKLSIREIELDTPFSITASLVGDEIRIQGFSEIDTTWFGFDAPTKFNAWEVLNPIGLTVDLVAKQK
ncbi:MAG: YceI family protein [Candidatus Actinomarina sp.]